MLWGRSVNIDGITIALISYKVHIYMYLYLEQQDISCIESFCFRLCYDIGITCRQLYKLRSIHFVRCVFLGFL